MKVYQILPSYDIENEEKYCFGTSHDEYMVLSLDQYPESFRRIV